MSKCDAVNIKHFHIVNVCTIRADGDVNFLLNLVDLTFSLHTVSAFRLKKLHIFGKIC